TAEQAFYFLFSAIHLPPVEEGEFLLTFVKKYILSRFPYGDSHRQVWPSFAGHTYNKRHLRRDAFHIKLKSTII
uniref:hypothetical protein n=1 Tax=Coprococcus catus TaxID=116085 RepID=UPI001AD7E94C